MFEKNKNSYSLPFFFFFFFVYRLMIFCDVPVGTYLGYSELLI